MNCAREGIPTDQKCSRYRARKRLHAARVNDFFVVGPTGSVCIEFHPTRSEHGDAVIGPDPSFHPRRSPRVFKICNRLHKFFSSAHAQWTQPVDGRCSVLNGRAGCKFRARCATSARIERSIQKKMRDHQNAPQSSNVAILRINDPCQSPPPSPLANLFLLGRMRSLKRDP